MFFNRSDNVDDDTAHYNVCHYNHCNNSEYNNRHDDHFNVW